MAKLILYITPTDTTQNSEFGNAISEISKLIPDAQVSLHNAVVDDPMASTSNKVSLPKLIIDITLTAGTPLKPHHDSIVSIITAAGSSEKAHSFAACGYEKSFRGTKNTTMRCNYLMQRRATFSQADYLDYYTHHHFGFGIVTPNIDGYSQTYIDSIASEEINAQLGFNHCPFDSISTMYMNSLDDFLNSDAIAIIGPGAIYDEEKFVDRDGSMMFMSQAL